MNAISSENILFIMASAAFVLGAVSTLAGVFLLVSRAAGKEVRTLAEQTTRLVQKGLAEEVAGLVGNASSLLETLNQMTRTTAGIGVFLTLFGLLLMACACWLTLQVR